MRFLKSIKESCKITLNNKALFTGICALDFLFFIIAGFASTIYQEKMLDIILDINTMMSTQLVNATDMAGLSESFNAFPMEMFESYYTAFIKLFLGMVFVLFILFLIFHGLNWFLSNRLHRRKIMSKFMPFFGKFALVSVIFGSIKALILGVVLNALASKLGMQLALEPNAIFVLLLVLCLIIDYFGITAYALCNHKIKDMFKKTVTYCFKDIKKLLPSYVFILFLYAIVFALFYYAMALHMMMPLLVIVLFLVPLTAWARIYYINVVESIDDKKHHKKSKKKLSVKKKEHKKIIKKKSKKKLKKKYKLNLF